MSEELRWLISTGIAVVVLFLVVYLFNLIRAPLLIKFEKEKQPRITMKSSSGRRHFGTEHEHLMWAELSIANTSPSLPLKDVEVRVVSCLQPIKKDDSRGDWYLCDMWDWNPAHVCWSERNAEPSQYKLTIPPNSTRDVLVAFCDDTNGTLSIFNTALKRKQQIYDGAKIEVVVSSANSPLQRGEFYIQCHPNYITADSPYRTEATFEFIEWQAWMAKHGVVNLSTLDMEDSQSQ